VNESRPLLRVIETQRLTLVAASEDLVEADLYDAGAFAQALDAEVPVEWPPELFGSTVMRAARAQLRNPQEQGWSVWYLLQRSAPRPVLVGMGQFKGRPDAAGSVEIAYAILPPFRGRGFATEAVSRLVTWAFTHQNVVRVTAETLPYLRGSIRVLEKVGMTPAGAGSEYGVVRYAILKSGSR
jgi:ribosomal-protein-alanine N-acetyltransferase